jgi:alkanesulfonate monooxygenase SsuD/methylene tetrahydromethanopterin reductase-like flavin-dependent oxidoreductase (luciferase family)
VPILVGGQGERRTLRLVAQYADACNVFGDADTVRHKLEVLAGHCSAVGRDPAEIEVTHLGAVLAAADRAALDARVDELRPRTTTREAFAAQVNAGTVEDHIGRFRQLAESGVQTAIVSLSDVEYPTAIEDFSPVIAAFRQEGYR